MTYWHLYWGFEYRVRRGVPRSPLFFSLPRATPQHSFGMASHQLMTMLVGEGAKIDVHGCKTVDMASSFGKALLEFTFIVFACITLLLGINAAKSKAAGKVLFPATFVTGISAIAYFSMASGGGWVIAPDCRQLFIAHYVDWIITTPLILICLGVVAGVDRWDIMSLVLADGESCE